MPDSPFAARVRELWALVESHSAEGLNVWPHLLEAAASHGDLRVDVAAGRVRFRGGPEVHWVEAQSGLAKFRWLLARMGVLLRDGGHHECGLYSGHAVIAVEERSSIATLEYDNVRGRERLWVRLDAIARDPAKDESVARRS